jgi:hypothetical protein
VLKEDSDIVQDDLLCTDDKNISVDEVNLVVDGKNISTIFI